MRLLLFLQKKYHQSLIKVSFHLFFTKYFMPSLILLCFNSLMFASFRPNPIRLITLWNETVASYGCCVRL